ncbi:MAG: hypothetical protein R6U31_04685 [bacterium]
MSTLYNKAMRIIARLLHFSGLLFIAVALSVTAMGFAGGLHYSLFPSLAHEASVEAVAQSPDDFDGKWVMVEGMYYNTEDMSGRKGVLVPLSSPPQYYTLNELKQFIESSDIPDSIPAMRPYPRNAVRMFIPASIGLLYPGHSFNAVSGDTITVTGKFLHDGGIVFPGGDYIRIVSIMSAGSSPENNAIILIIIILFMTACGIGMIRISRNIPGSSQPESSSSL